MKKSIPLALSTLLIATFFTVPAPKPASAAVPGLIFPMLGGASYWNDFGAPRDGGARSHEGNDLIASKHTPVLAVANGTISRVNFPEPSWGMAITLRAENGYEYRYLHINNDRPGTDDNSALPWFAYAPDTDAGMYVRAGQLIGYNGDSGNAEHTTAHIHFEMRDPNRNLVNPYESLQAATVLNTPYPAARQTGEILPYGDLTLGANVALGQLDGDTGYEIITAPLAGGGPHIRTYDSDGKTAITGFFAYQRDYPGGADITAGDLDGDGIDEIITGAGPGGTAHVRTFTVAGDPYGVEFLAFPEGFSGGVRLAAADLDGDGRDEIIAGAGPGGSPNVRIFSPEGIMQLEWNAYAPGFSGGIDVAATDGTQSTSGSIVTAPLEGGGPHIKIFDRSGNLTNEFMAYGSDFRGGVHISARVGSGSSSGSDAYGRWWWNNVLVSHNDPVCEEGIRYDAYGNPYSYQECTDPNAPDPDSGDGDTGSNTGTTTPSGSIQIFTVPASSGGPDIRQYNEVGDRLDRDTDLFAEWWIGGYDIGAGPNTVYVASTSGPEPGVERRTSVRPAPSSIAR